MSKIKFVFLILCYLFGSMAVIIAQSDDDGDYGMEEMDEEEWQRQTDELATRKIDLRSQLKSLNSDVDNLKQLKKSKDGELEQSEKSLYASVGTTKTQVADYRRKFETLEKKINSKSGSKEDAEKEFTEIEASKIKCLPEFWDRYQAQKKKLVEWSPENVQYFIYEVVKGDNLILISQKIYGSKELVDIIVEENEIFNKNEVFEGQFLTLPQKLYKPICIFDKDDIITKSWYANKVIARNFGEGHKKETTHQYRLDEKEAIREER